MFRSQTERLVADMDLVKREDFDVVRDMASQARAENERLAARVAALEAQLAGLPAKPESGRRRREQAEAPRSQSEAARAQAGR